MRSLLLNNVYNINWNEYYNSVIVYVLSDSVSVFLTIFISVIMYQKIILKNEVT